MYNNTGKRKSRVRIKDVTNYKNSINYECNHCDYVCHGFTGAKLHLKYTHGVDEKKSSINIEQFCTRCRTVFYGSVSEHMIRHREEI